LYVNLFPRALVFDHLAIVLLRDEIVVLRVLSDADLHDLGRDGDRHAGHFHPRRDLPLVVGALRVRSGRRHKRNGNGDERASGRAQSIAMDAIHS
jgi:hypothetical protein